MSEMQVVETTAKPVHENLPFGHARAAASGCVVFRYSAFFQRISFEKEIPSGGSQAGNISQSCSLRLPSDMRVRRPPGQGSAHTARPMFFQDFPIRTDSLYPHSRYLPLSSGLQGEEGAREDPRQGSRQHPLGYGATCLTPLF